MHPNRPNDSIKIQSLIEKSNKNRIQMALKLTSKSSFRTNKTNSIMHIEFRNVFFGNFIRIWDGPLHDAISISAMDQVICSAAAQQPNHFVHYYPFENAVLWSAYVFGCAAVRPLTLGPLRRALNLAPIVPFFSPYSFSHIFFVHQTFIYALFQKA